MLSIGTTVLFHDGGGKLKHGIVIGTCPDGCVRVQTALTGIYTVPTAKARVVDDKRLLEVLEKPMNGWLPKKTTLELLAESRKQN